jgi:hypothetical protein
LSLRIAILGAASDSLIGVPWDSADVEFWAGASFYKFHPRLSSSVDCWFELHNRPERLRTGWLGWAIETQQKCYLQEAHPELSRSEAYPLEEIATRFGRYFTSTVAYMMASAIHARAEEIFLFGVDMKVVDELGNEYRDQRPCVEYMIGFAQGLGIDVCIHEQSPLLKADGLYGYESKKGKHGWVSPKTVAA